MKYCINYTKKPFRYLSNVDEITVPYRSSDTSLLSFMQEHGDQRINVSITDAADFLTHNGAKLINAIADEHPELSFAVRLGDYRDEQMQEIRESIINVPFYFSTLATDWDTFTGLLSYHPSEVYVAEALGFEIKQCAEIAHGQNCLIRVFPNVAQSPWKGLPAIKKFFIRPEDVEYYEPYVDVMEFYGDPDHVATYYKVYAIDKEWFGNLREIVIDFDEDVDSRCLLPNFSNRRLNCGHRCLKGQPCDICTAQQDLASTLNKYHVSIKDLTKKSN